MPEGYCERVDVRRALQEAEFPGALGQDGELVDNAITGLTQWLRRRTSRHWFDSSGGTTLVPTGPRSVSGIRLDVPSSPHAQDRQLLRDEHGVRYPVTQSGPYCSIRLPHYGVSSLTTLEVRDRGGGVTDWVAASDKVAGRGEDYFLHTVDDGTQTSHLYIRAASIGSRVDYSDLLTVGYDYGTDQASRSWETVRRAVAKLAAADLVIDDDVKTAIANDGQLIGVDTKADKLFKQAMRSLGPIMETPIA